MLENNILLIDAFSTGKAYIDKINELGIGYIHLVSRRDLIESYGHPDSDPDKTIISDCFDDAINIARKMDFDIAIACSEPAVDVFGHLNFEDNHPAYNPPSRSRAKFDKHEMGMLVKAYGIRSIPDILVTDINDLICFFERHNESVVLKPTHSAGSDQVYICKDQVQLKNAFNSIYLNKNALANINYCVYAQKYIEGKQYIVNGIVDKGIVYFTDLWFDVRDIRLGKAILDYEENIDSTFPKYNELTGFSEKVLSSLGYKNGPFHMELIENDDDELYLIEVANRVMGSLSIEAYQNIFLFDPISLHVDQILNRGIEKPLLRCNDYTRCVTIRSFTEGELKIDISKFLYELNTYKGSYGIVSKGSAVREYQDLFCNLGTVYLSGKKDDVESDYNLIRVLEKKLIKESSVLEF